MYSTEERLADKAVAYFTEYGTQEKGNLNINQRVILRLAKEMLSIWNEWRSDTRHYNPSQKKYDWYMELVGAGEAMLDAEATVYEEAKNFIAEYRRFISLVVRYRMRNSGGIAF